MRDQISRLVLVCLALIAGLSAAAAAAVPAAAPLVRGPVNDALTVPLTRDLPRALTAARDQGVLSANTPLAHIHLTLVRPAIQQAALDTLVHGQHVRGSTTYRQWLTPSQLRAYGPAQSDISAVIAWLSRHGLTANAVSPSGMSIDFGGSAAAVAAAFHTQLHNVAYRGEAHIANMTAPAIPAALAPVVGGVTLANFFPKPALERRTPSLTSTFDNTTFYAVTPADFATIYNINPLRGKFNFFNQPITGKGVTLAVVERTKMQVKDWQLFRQTFGLSGFTGTLTEVNPGGCGLNYNGDEAEAAIDAEWAGAVAPDANIIEASCADASPFDFGVESALQNLVELGTPATIFSISYEGDELEDGFAFQLGWSNLIEEGAAQGKSIFVAAGDNGVSADEGSIDSHGLFVNGLADTPYNVSVGGTDFYDSALGENATYWHASNSADGSSAISYIPEIPWDNSCASSIIWSFYKASGALAFCNSNPTANPAISLQNDIGGSGSQSLYYPKPDWQLTSVLGMPNDGVRDQPDVSLFAANGIWNHFYLECMSDIAEGGAPCHYSNIYDFFASAYGGTSFGAPDFAGIQALIQQTADLAFGQVIPLGNPAPAFYQIAQAQFQTPLGLSKCNATLGNKISTACVFNYVTAGSNEEPCYAGSSSCFSTSQSTAGIGVLGAFVGRTSTFAYPAQTGYSLATGLGTVNVTNLVYQYPF